MLGDIEASAIVDKACELITAFGGKSPGRNCAASDFLFSESGLRIEGRRFISHHEINEHSEIALQIVDCNVRPTL